MSILNNYNGRYCESEFECAFLGWLEDAGWDYLAGSSIPRRTQREVLYEDDMQRFLSKTNPELEMDEIKQIIDIVRLVGAESSFAVLHKMYGWMVNGIMFTPHNGLAEMISLIDFERPENNIFRAVNQLTVEYSENGQTEYRKPDIVLYVNGIPVCIIELKNPANPHAGIYEAWEQIYRRYWRDIPHLLHYCPLACISDGVKTRLGTVRTSYEHFYAWRRVNENDDDADRPFDELNAMLAGVFSADRFLEIFRDYIYFRDSEYDGDEVGIVCRYPQFFATRLLKRSIVKSVIDQSGKGGTYFGATGCGKTYTMAFLARQLALRCKDVPEMGSPTIVVIVDREDLQDQGAKIFTKSKEFLNLGEVKVINSRAELRKELSVRGSGGFYICTIQKFCDRKEDKIGLINERANIICFSDEAHRTQVERSQKIKFSKDADENIKAMISKPYAKVLKEAFPRATFVGFTGTPIAETYQTFGEEVDRYTMDRAVADGITVPIKYHPRITRVLPDDEKVKEIEDYYSKCYDEGTTEEDIAASKRAMSSMEVILGEPTRLERLAEDIHDHYTASCENDPETAQKAMIVCSNRTIAYALLKKFEEKYPEWFEEKKVPDGIPVSAEELKSLKPMPTVAMIASVGANDTAEMYNYLGGTQNDARSEKMGAAFKQEKSNFRMAIVVDMWMTGFDVPSLKYMYNDKPLKKHLLIQTISRINRKFRGKEYGIVIDYIGIRNNMRKALKLYGGDYSVAPAADDVELAKAAFKDEILILKNLFSEYDLHPFVDCDADPAERYRLLAKAAEYVFASVKEVQAVCADGTAAGKVTFKTYFLKTVKRMRASYDMCLPSGELDEEETAMAQCFMAIAGFVRKMNGTDTDVDAETMNIHVSKMVEEALKYNEVESILREGRQEDIFESEYFNKLANVKMPASRLELLTKMLRVQIREYSKTNQTAAKRFRDMLEKTIDEYHERKNRLSEEDYAMEYVSDGVIEAATERAMHIVDEMNGDRDSFRRMGLGYEEKSFYDILLNVSKKYGFEYGSFETENGVTVNKQCKKLAKQIKATVDEKSTVADWLNNQRIRNELKFDVKVCLVKGGYPPQYSPEVFRRVMEQTESFKKA